MDDRTYPDELARLRAENERLRNELDAMTAHYLNTENEAKRLRAELDAMRQAHSVIAARCEAMGC